MAIFTLGFLVTRFEHEQAYFTNVAKAAIDEKIECVRFQPDDIDLSLNMISCLRFNTKSMSWSPSSESIPPFIYDRCFYGQDRASFIQKKLVQLLKNKPEITFLGHGLPNKWSLYTSLKRTNVSTLLPETILVQNESVVFDYLSKENACMLKPLSGANGTGIVTIHKRDEQFIFFYSTNKQSYHRKNSAKRVVSRIVKQKRYILQPLLPLQTKENKPFDLRLFVQKDEHGKWCVRGKAIRIGRKNSFVSNLSKGGTIHDFKDWLQTISLPKRQILMENIQSMLATLLPILDQHYEPLFEIGIDVGIHLQDASIWIIDINSKPGRKIVYETEPHKQMEIFKAPLLYAKFLRNEQTSVKDGM
ncbi:YheC/YheD family protein [Bacillus sp. FJAT-47783]|uniref:YheC/YheD family endospore coat-associated protein n=1 Tax=Bacillus sp. FJAT-47783 TaxID=2922712 RepID=UPI001FAD29F2|nr:YheC/YheD family protein [Bacillus sp. FJAT-47783]